MLVVWIGYDGTYNVAGPVHRWLTGFFSISEKIAKTERQIAQGKGGDIEHALTSHKHNSRDNEWRPNLSSSIWKMVCAWQMRVMINSKSNALFFCISFSFSLKLLINRSNSQVAFQEQFISMLLFRNHVSNDIVALFCFLKNNNASFWWIDWLCSNRQKPFTVDGFLHQMHDDSAAQPATTPFR